MACVLKQPLTIKFSCLLLTYAFQHPVHMYQKYKREGAGQFLHVKKFLTKNTKHIHWTGQNLLSLVTCVV